MAKPAKPRAPKVYWAEIDGLNEWIVAAPNRAEALAALDVRQDLFGQDQAGEETDLDKVKAARAAPGIPLRRPRGSKAPFAPAGAAADWSSAMPKGSKAKAKAKKPDRRAIDEAEARLGDIEHEHAEAMGEIAADRQRLDEREARETERYEARRSDAETVRDKAAETFGRAVKPSVKADRISGNGVG